MFSFILDKYPGVELLGNREDVNLTLKKKETCQMVRLNHIFEMWAFQFYTPNPPIFKGRNTGIYPTENRIYAPKL